MTFGKRILQIGFSLIEMIMVLAIAGVLVVLGSAIVSKLGPNYVSGSRATQAMGPANAAVWQMRRDFEKMVVSGTSQVGCTLTIHTSSVGASTSTTDISYTYSSGQISRNGTAILSNITPTSSCPYTLVLGSGTTPSQLLLDFTYTVGSYVSATNPVLVSLYSYKAGPDLTSVQLTASSSACDVATNTSAATIGGSSLTGTTLVSFGGSSVATLLTVVSDILLSFQAPAHANGLVSVAVTTPEGISTLPYAFRYVTLSSTSGSGGDTISISGVGLSDATGVSFGGVAGTSFSVTGDTLISVTTPTGQPTGAVNVVIQGISPGCTLTNAYTFN